MDDNLFLEAIAKTLAVCPGPGLLLLSGEPSKEQNLITIGWIQFGKLWNKPVVTVYIRESRHSFKLINESEYFTLNVLDVAKYDKALSQCASTSGRDTDKFALTGLTKVLSDSKESSCLAEASCAIECRAIARNMLTGNEMNKEHVDRFYVDADYHQQITAEIINIIVK